MDGASFTTEWPRPWGTVAGGALTRPWMGGRGVEQARNDSGRAKRVSSSPLSFLSCWAQGRAADFEGSWEVSNNEKRVAKLVAFLETAPAERRQSRGKGLSNLDPGESSGGRDSKAQRTPEKFWGGGAFKLGAMGRQQEEHLVQTDVI